MIRPILNDEKNWKLDYQPPKAHLCHCVTAAVDQFCFLLYVSDILKQIRY